MSTMQVVHLTEAVIRTQSKQRNDINLNNGDLKGTGHHLSVLIKKETPIDHTVGLNGSWVKVPYRHI